MDLDEDGAVSMMEWLQFFARMCQEKGHKVSPVPCTKIDPDLTFEYIFLPYL